MVAIPHRPILLACLLTAIFVIPSVVALPRQIEYYHVEAPAMIGEVSFFSEGDVIPASVIPVSASELTFDHWKEIECNNGLTVTDTFDIKGDIIGHATNALGSKDITWTYLGLIWTGEYSEPSLPSTEIDPGIYPVTSILTGSATTTLANIQAIRETFESMSSNLDPDPLKVVGSLGLDLITLHMTWTGSGDAAGYGHVIPTTACDKHS